MDFQYVYFQGGLGHNLLMQFSTLLTSKMEISESDFFFFSPFTMSEYRM